MFRFTDPPHHVRKLWRLALLFLACALISAGFAPIQGRDTLSPAAAPPASFHKTYPINGATDSPTHPTLKWNFSRLATSYSYCLDTSNDNACTLPASWKSTGTPTSIFLNNLTPGIPYFWQVRATNSSGTTEADGGTWYSFTIPLPPAFNKTSPANAASDQPTNPTLRWGAMAGVDRYEYCIDTSSNNTCNTSWISTARNTSVSLSGLILGDTYSWQVRARPMAGLAYPRQPRVRTAAGYAYADGGTWGSFTVTTSWSTNFADVTDLAAAGINAYGASAAIDTSNVNSGGKSIKVYGTIGPRGSCLNLNFGLWGLAGRDSVDLSKDVLKIEMYLPADSPIYDLVIHVFSGGQYVQVRMAHDAIYRGQWHTYTVDIREDISLKTWRTYSWLTSPGLTDVQVVEVIKNAQSIGIVGVVQKDHTPAESYFLVDRMGWESAGPAPAYDASVDSLRKYAPASLPIGGLMEPDGAMEPEYIQNFVQEFNATQAWGLFPAMEPAGDVFAYDASWSPMPYADYFNETQGFPLLRYSGIGETPFWIPAWLPGKSYVQAQTILDDFTHALVDHYKGKTFIWILFNELLRYDLPFTPFSGLGLKDRNQSPQTWGDNYSPWSSSPSDVSMIEEAFQVARTADPSALLIVNEGYGSAEGTVPGEALYALATQMKSDGTPIDGVGFESHMILDQAGNFHEGSTSQPVLAFDPTYGFTDIAANIERYAALGLKVAFTEVDVSIYLADIDPSTPAGQALLAQRRGLQAAAYRSLLHIALTHPNVVFFNLWDWADEYSWTDPEVGWYPPAGFGNDLGLFDWFYQKKLAYTAMLDELKAAQLPLPGTFDKVSPAEGATEQPTNPTLSWEASTGATSYEYCIDSSNNNGCDTSWISTGASTSVAISGLLPLTTYSWQVRVRGASGVIHANHGTWGSFTTVTDWSTNFADVTDLALSGIFSPSNSLAIDMTNVHSSGKSIKIYGTIGPMGSQFNLNFRTWGLTGHDSFDLSEKTISYEIYLPADSPLDYLDFFIFKGDQYVVIYADYDDLHKGGWATYSVDISEVIALQSWKADSWMISPGLTDEEAVNVLKNAQTITIMGGVSTDHTPLESYFLVDRLGWETSSP